MIHKKLITMSAFSHLCRDNISILSNNGIIKAENVKANVSSKGISIFRSDIIIRSGDIILRNMPNGEIERFEVIDPGFSEGLGGGGGIPPHYRLSVRKLGLPETPKTENSSITYNITGDNARINQDSVDNSIYIANSHVVIDKIADLRKELQTIDLGADDKKSAYEVIDAIEKLFQAGKPQKSVVEALLNALPKLGSVASIGSFILSCL